MGLCARRLIGHCANFGSNRYVAFLWQHPWISVLSVSYTHLDVYKRQVQDCLDLVGDDDVGMQVRVARAGVEVIERRRHQPGDIDLCNGPVPGGCTMSLIHI